MRFEWSHSTYTIIVMRRNRKRDLRMLRVRRLQRKRYDLSQVAPKVSQGASVANLHELHEHSQAA